LPVSITRIVKCSSTIDATSSTFCRVNGGRHWGVEPITEAKLVCVTVYPRNWDCVRTPEMFATNSPMPSWGSPSARYASWPLSSDVSRMATEPPRIAARTPPSRIESGVFPAVPFLLATNTPTARVQLDCRINASKRPWSTIRRRAAASAWDGSSFSKPPDKRFKKPRSPSRAGTAGSSSSSASGSASVTGAFTGAARAVAFLSSRAAWTIPGVNRFNEWIRRLFKSLTTVTGAGSGRSSVSTYMPERRAPGKFTSVMERSHLPRFPTQDSNEPRSLQTPLLHRYQKAPTELHRLDQGAIVPVSTRICMSSHAIVACFTLQ
jgi:hypothetical protein